MKKTIIALLFIIAFLLVGCNNGDDSIQITDASLDPVGKGIKLIGKIDYDTMKIAEDKIVSYGIIYLNQENATVADVTYDTKDGFVETDSTQNGEFTVTLTEIDKSLYNSTFAFRAYIKYYDDQGVLRIRLSSSLKEAVLYDLAKDANNSEFAEEVILSVDKIKVTTVDISINFTLVTAIPNSSNYTVNVTKNGYIYTILVTLKEGYKFDENVRLIMNSTLIDASKIIIEGEVMTYHYDNTPKPTDYIPVKVAFDLNEGTWTSSFFTNYPALNTVTATTKNDLKETTITIVDNGEVSYRWFYKIFVKYDETVNAYKIVAVDPAKGIIADLDLPEYDYVLCAHENAIDTNSLIIIKNYSLSLDSVGMYITFSSDINEYQTGDIQISFYPYDAATKIYEEVYLNAVNLPYPSRKEYNFVGWSDGENTFTKFPQYQLLQNIESITYTAVWQALTIQDFTDKIVKDIENLVVTDITLPSTFSAFNITWESSHPDIIASNGLYRKPYVGTTVTLTATVTSDTVNEVLQFEVTTSGFKPLESNIASSYIYREYYAVTDQFFQVLDIINCAFITAKGDGTLTGAGFLAQVQTYIMPKAHRAGDWVVMSIAPESDWSTVSSTDALRNNFADNIVNTINTYGFDGVDIDWEFPKNDTETSNFVLMMEVIYKKVKANNPNHLVTAAIGAGMWQPPRYNLSASQKYIDFINMMAYSMTSNSGQYQNALYPNSDKDNVEANAGYTLVSCSVSESLDIYKTYQIPNRKIIVGVAFYGVKQIRTYNSTTSSYSAWTSGGSVFYTSIDKNYLNNSNYTLYFDEVSRVPYLLKNDLTEFISFDDPQSIEEKAAYVISNGLGGIMYWENGCDTTGKLLQAMKTGLNK